MPQPSVCFGMGPPTMSAPAQYAGPPMSRPNPPQFTQPSSGLFSGSQPPVGNIRTFGGSRPQNQAQPAGMPGMSFGAAPSPPSMPLSFGPPQGSLAVMQKPGSHPGLFPTRSMPEAPRNPIQSHPASLSPSNPQLSSSSFLDIITKQAASGLWPGSAYPELQSTRPSTLTEDQWSTICVLMLLKLKFKERAEESELIVRKAVRALEAAGVVIGEHEEVATITVLSVL